MIIDWQHHYIPEALWKRRGGRKGEVVIRREKGRPQLVLHEGLFRIEDHLRDMDFAGIDLAVLSLGGESLEECRIINDSLAQVMKEHPRRFVGLVHTMPLGGEPALEELERAVNGLGLRGVVISSQIEGRPLDSQELHPFYEKVARLGVPIFVHVTSIPPGYVALAASYDLLRSIGREFDLCAATCRLILGGVLEDFPGLKFVIGHFGGGIAAILERIEVTEVLEGKRVIHYFREGTRISQPFRHYLDQLYFDTAGFQGGHGALACALTALKPERLVFATDYPQNFRGDAQGMRAFVEDIKGLPLPQPTREAILGGNAAALLGL